MNISTSRSFVESAAQFFRILGQPLRIQILLILAGEDACVCHMEASLGVRQALLSQHLMVLRDAGLVTSYREGRNIYYRLAAPVMPLLEEAARRLSYTAEVLQSPAPLSPCPCPRCNPQAGEEICCSDMPSEEKDATCP